MNSFYRKVAFGIRPGKDLPNDPITWSNNQLNLVPDLSWSGKLHSEEELKTFLRKELIMKDNLKKLFKNDPEKLKSERKKLNFKYGKQLWKSLEIAVRHNEAINGPSPVLTKLWFFWGNHFAINKPMLSNYTVGAYNRDVIWKNLDQKFEKMVYDATISWSMIHQLDNSQSVGPDSISAKEKWRSKKKRPATINENHARELMELHTVSPKAGYTQNDVVQLAYIMTGWRYDRNKEIKYTGDIYFDEKFHQPGTKTVLSKTYSSGKKSLKNVIRDLVNSDHCREFIADKLCRFYLTDEPTKSMKQPIIKAFKDSDGYLPEIHKATIKVVLENNESYSKFQNPENWFLQKSNLVNFKLISSYENLKNYKLGEKPNKKHKIPMQIVKSIGQDPYRPKQVNGWSDYSSDWISPEFLIRRLILCEKSYKQTNKENRKIEYYEDLITKNFNNPGKVLKLINKKLPLRDLHNIIFNHPEFLKA